MVLPKRKSILSQEERIARLKESRLKYSQMGKPKTATSSRLDSRQPMVLPSQNRIAAKLVNRPVPLPKPLVARTSVAPTASKSHQEDDFEVDPNSLAMIQSGRITIPVNRPSVISSRHTIGSRQSLIGRSINRARVSIAQEPRTSLFPLGINVFEANATQRSEVSDFLNNMMSTTTPAKQNTFTNEKVLGSALNSTRHRKIRFMDTAIQEVRESAESAEVAAASEVHHSPTHDTSFMPASILSTKKKNRKKVNLDDPASSTPKRTINFEEEGEESKKSPEKENIEKEILNLERVSNLLADSELQLSNEHKNRIRNAIGKLKNNLDIDDKEEKNVLKTQKQTISVSSVPMTPLGAIMESLVMEDDQVDEEEIEFLERKKKRRRSSKMKVGGEIRKSILSRRASRSQD